MSEEHETQDEVDLVEFDVPLNKATVAALAMGMLRDIADVAYEYLDVAFNLAAAHSHWQRKQEDAKDASKFLEKLLEGDDGR